MHPGSFQGTRLDRPVLDLGPVAEADGMNHPTLEANVRRAMVECSDRAPNTGRKKARQLAADGLE